MSVSPRVFALIIGGILALGAVIALAIPISIDGGGGDSVGCGDGFKGLSQEASYRDAGRAIGDAMYPDFADSTDTELSLEEQCRDAVSTRRAWGWPLGGIGVVVLLGAALVRIPRQPAQ